MMDDGTAPVPAELASLVSRLGRLPEAADDAERIDRIAALESLKAAAAAAQVRETAAFAVSQLAEQRACGVTRERLGRGIAEQVGLARRVSPATGSRQVTFARALTEELPETLSLLRAGQVSEWVATLVTAETSALEVADRRRVDAELAPDLPAMSPKRAAAAARRLAIQADPESALRRARTARSDRRVGVRPAPDTMAVLSAFVPAEQGIGAWACLRTHAQHEKNTGDARGLGQIMADTLIERLTGQPSAAATPVEIGLTMTADALLAGDDTPATLTGYGPLPAQLARDLVTDHDQGDREGERARVFLRRIFTDPIDETVAHIDTRRRRFDGPLARLLVYRDQGCRDPYCDAPIRHHDHITAHRDGGSTTATNGQGLCERGNHVKEMPGWSTRLLTAKRHQTETTTPTGHHYRSSPPPALGPASNSQQRTHRIATRRLASLKAQLGSASRPPPPPP